LRNKAVVRYYSPLEIYSVFLNIYVYIQYIYLFIVLFFIVFYLYFCIIYLQKSYYNDIYINIYTCFSVAYSLTG